MATFTVQIETPTKCKPRSRLDDVNERAAIQQALLTIVGAVSNTGAYEGNVSGGAATATFGYEAEND